jgi:AraC-like DNA-binding protein
MTSIFVNTDTSGAHIIKEQPVKRDNLYLFSGNERWSPRPEWGHGELSAVAMLSGLARLERGDRQETVAASQALVFTNAGVDAVLHEGEGVIFHAAELAALGALQDLPLALDPLALDLIRTVLLSGDCTPDHQQAAIRLFCYQLVAAEPASATREELTDVDDMSAWLIEHMDESLTLDALARQFGCSRSTILNRFRKQLGQSPMRHLAARRCEHARHALEQTDHSITEIARAVGYPDLPSFTRFIKTKTGHAPTELRRRARWVV